MPKKFSSKSKNPFQRATVILVALVIVVVFINLVTQTDLINNIILAFEQSGSKYEDLVEFSKEERDSTIKRMAGFWEFRSEEGGDFRKVDRIELKENGYIWRVEEFFYTMPTGEAKSIVHATHAYLHPSSKSTGKLGGLNCVLRTFNQLWIHGDDTCEIQKYIGLNTSDALSDVIADVVVKESYDRSVDVVFNDSTFEFEGERLNPFSSNAIASFFPEGLIELLYDRLRNITVDDSASYSLEDNKSSRQPFGQCKADIDYYDFIRDAFTGHYQSITLQEREEAMVDEIIAKYYSPLFITAQRFADVKEKGKKTRIEATFSVNWKGVVENLKIDVSGSAIDKKWRIENIAKEISQWKFPALEKEINPQSFVFRKTLP